MKLTTPLIPICMLSFMLFSCQHKDNDDPLPPGSAPKTNEEQLPPITTTGAGTFGCKVNGKVWVAKNKGSFPYVYASMDKANNNLMNICGNNIHNPSFFHTIGLSLFYVPSRSVYPLFVDMYKFNIYYGGSYIDADNNQFWETDSITGGVVRLLRVDTVNQIVSGTFSFDCIHRETHDTLHITEGRFDMIFLY